MIAGILPELEHSLDRIRPRAARSLVAGRLALAAAGGGQDDRARQLLDTARRLAATLPQGETAITEVDALVIGVILSEPQSATRLLDRFRALGQRLDRWRARAAFLHGVRLTALGRRHLDPALVLELGRILETIDPPVRAARVLRDAALDLARLELGDAVARAGRRLLAIEVELGALAVAQDAIAAMAIACRQLREHDLTQLARRAEQHADQVDAGLVRALASEAGRASGLSALFEPVATRMALATNRRAALWVEIALARAGALHAHDRLARLCDNVFEIDVSPDERAEMVAETIPALVRTLPDETAVDLLEAARERAIGEQVPEARVQILEAVAHGAGRLIAFTGARELSRRLLTGETNEILAVTEALLRGARGAERARAQDLAEDALSALPLASGGVVRRTRSAILAFARAADRSAARARARELIINGFENAPRSSRVALARVLHEAETHALGPDRERLGRELLRAELDGPPGRHTVHVLDALLRLDDGFAVGEIPIESEPVVMRAHAILGADLTDSFDGVHTGFPSLDNALSKVSIGDTVVVAGRMPALAAEAVAAHATIEAVMRHPDALAVVVVRPENEPRWRDGLVAAASGVSFRRVRERAFLPAEERRVVGARILVDRCARLICRAGSPEWIGESEDAIGSTPASLLVVDADASEVDALLPAVAELAMVLGVPAVIAVELSHEPPESVWEDHDKNRPERSFVPTLGEVGWRRRQHTTVLVHRPSFYDSHESRSGAHPDLLQLAVYSPGEASGSILEVMLPR